MQTHIFSFHSDFKDSTIILETNQNQIPNSTKNYKRTCFRMTSASYDSNFTVAAHDGDPQRRVGNTRTIAGANMLLGVVSMIYHIWTAVGLLKNPQLIVDSGQEEVVVYMGLVIMLIIGFILLPISWNLYKAVATIRSTPITAMRSCKCWRRWMGCFLTFLIISLMILVLGSDRKSHQGVVQNYMAGLLIISTFTIFGLYYVGKLVDDIKNYNPNEVTDLDNVFPPTNVSSGMIPGS